MTSEYLDKPKPKRSSYIPKKKAPTLINKSGDADKIRKNYNKGQRSTMYHPGLGIVWGKTRRKQK